MSGYPYPFEPEFGGMRVVVEGAAPQGAVFRFENDSDREVEFLFAPSLYIFDGEK